ncbi:MAG: TonB-dependent receptor [Candidatus Acidiferrales bacterium]
MKRFRNLCMLLAMLLLAVPTARAQFAQGQINGQVTDSSGGVIPGASVTIENLGTQVKRSLAANASGEYNALNLDPGAYSVTVEAPNFKTFVRERVQIEVGLSVRVDVQLSPGQVNETVVVKDETPLTDTTDTTLNGVLSNKAINELPVQGRDFQNLLMLHPGVQRTPGGGFQSITSNGNRPDDNNFFVDGADDTDAYYGEGVLNEAGIEGTPASILPLDAIQEFNTQESPSADYGVKPGVVMNIGIRSGTDQIHGTAYYFTRNSAADARNYFDPAPESVADLIMHEFGGSIGGPIKKDKWFYFVNYEGIRDKVGNPIVTNSPVTVTMEPYAAQLLAQTGLLPEDVSIVDALNGCAPNCSPLSVKLSQLFLPNPGYTANQTDPTAINFNFTNTNRGDNIVAKTDFVVNSRNTLSGLFVYSNTQLVEEDTLPLRPQWLSGTSPITQLFGVNWAWTPSATWVNSLHFSYNRFSEAIDPLDGDVNPTAYGFTNDTVTDPRLLGMPRIGFSSEDFPSTAYLGGNSSWPLSTSPSATYNLSDTVSRTSGRHTIRFGGDFRYGDVNYFRAGYGRGRIDFGELPDFVAGNVRRWRYLYGNQNRDVSLKSFGLFVQNDFRITPRVTLNMGLRYDVTYPIKDSNNLLANFDPSIGIVQVGHGINELYPTNYNNVSPRLGIAWDVFGTGKTVVRAGGGLIYEQPSIRTFMYNGGGLNLNPTNVAGVTPGGGTISSFLQESNDPSFINWPTATNPNPGPLFPDASSNSCSLDNQCNIFAVNQNLRTPYTANWNLNVQQAVGPNAMLQVGYVANRGIRLYSVTDPNQVIYADDDGSETVGRPFNVNCSSPTGGPCFPYIGFESYLSNQANSNYNSLQATFTKRYSHGLYLLAGYTYAHAIDTSTSNLADTPQNSLDYRAERGNGDFDIRNRFTLSAIYDLPSRPSKFQMLEGWQVTGILMLEGGEPYTLTDFDDDISGTGEGADRWDMTGPASNIHWSPTTPVPYISYDTFTTDNNGNVIGGNQQCIASANTFGGQATVNQLANYGCFVSGSTVLTPPAFGAFGTMGRNIFRGPGFRNLDFSFSKVWRLNERLKLQFRAEFFNILNHPNFDVFTLNNDLGSPDSLGTVIATPDVGSASNPVIGSGGSRHVQLGVKFSW